MRIPRFSLLLLSLSATVLSAETKLVLNKATVAPSLDLLQVTVPAGERVVLSIPVLSGNVWFKDGNPIPGAGSRVLIIESARPEDSGRYRVGYVGEQANASQELALTVTPSGDSGTPSAHLATFTTRGWAGSGNQSLVAGFVVGEHATDPSATRRVLVRAVGPTLEDFGVADFLPAPVLAVYTAKGEACASLTADPLELTKAQLSAGAYPLKAGAADAWAVLRLAPGSYTAQVSSGGAQAGLVLLEIYELP